jgi:hypothetical protein
MKLFPIRPFICAISLTGLILGMNLARSESIYAFGVGAKGFIIEDLNQKLLEKAPQPVEEPRHLDQFDEATQNNLVSYRKSAGLPEGPPVATPKDFASLGLDWPSDPIRALQLINAYEGTLFKLEGPKESGDTTPKVTYGVIGFTSDDLSLQRFLYKMNTALGAELAIRVENFMSAKESEEFSRMIAIGGRSHVSSDDIAASNKIFVDWALKKPMGEPKDDIAMLFNSFQTIYGFGAEQMKLAKEKAWDDEVVDYYLPRAFPGRKTVSLKAMTFLLDLTVLTNGPGRPNKLKPTAEDWTIARRETWKRLDAQSYATEDERLMQIRQEMSVTFDGNKRDDVLQREMSIILGKGYVHGNDPEDYYDLKSYGLIPWPPSS